jgi:surfeit locus 1 family protein
MTSIQFRDYRFFTTWKILLMGILGIGILTTLGGWQLHRGHEKKQMLERYQAQDKQAPVLWPGGRTYPAPYQRIKLEGTYQPLQFLLDNQFYQHQWGYHVLSPFRLTSNGRVVMIDRGWIKGDESRQMLPKVAVPSGKQWIHGYVYYPQDNRWITQLPIPVSVNSPFIIEKFPTDRFASVFVEPALPFLLRLDKSVSDGWLRDWQIVSLPPERHYAYALQWFVLAVLLAGIFVRLQIRREPNE